MTQWLDAPSLSGVTTSPLMGLGRPSRAELLLPAGLLALVFALADQGQGRHGHLGRVEAEAPCLASTRPGTLSMARPQRQAMILTVLP